jgi:hypothetical protein
MTSESDPELEEILKPDQSYADIKLDMSIPYVRFTSTFPFPIGAGVHDLGPARQELAQTLIKAWRVYQASTDNGREGVRIALAAAFEFIKDADPQSAEMFERFHMVVIAALSDRDEGITAPLLNGAGQGRETNSFGYQDIQRRAAATMRGLMDIRYKRNEAAKKVAETLTKNGFPATQRMVKEWYDERLPPEAKQKGRPPQSAPGAQSEDAYLHYSVATNQERPTRTNEQYVKFLLGELTWFARLWFPSPPKGKT